MNAVGRIGFAIQDALIYASVVEHLRTTSHPGPHFFINKNWKDFDNPVVVTELAMLDCEFVSNFVDGALRLELPVLDP